MTDTGPPTRSAIAYAGALALLVALGGSVAAVSAPPPSSPDRSEVKAEGFTSARVCGECHSDIYGSWKNSLHAFSLSDPIFDTAYMQALKLGGREAGRLCLRCHAPMTMWNGDYDLDLGVTREGVSCDFCHTVTAVHLDGREAPYSVEPGLVKRSVLEKADSPAHEVAYSPLHGTSEFCGGCHNFLAASGTAILGTYDEWRNGPYAAEGIQCQECHMVLSRGRVASRAKTGNGGQIHLHNLLHDTDQLRSALTIRIANAERAGSRLVIDVEIENVGSGHMVPTGMPTREIVLTLLVESGGRARTQERRFRKVVADAKGRPLDQDYEVLLLGSQILNDNRIGPREKRIQRFTFDLRGPQKAKVTATISYRYSPLILRKQTLDIELGRAERHIF